MSLDRLAAEASKFYAGLEADNSRDYWLAHKATYDKALRAPMLELLALLEAEFGTAKVFRPNRDTRFSADKSPYKTQIAAVAGGVRIPGFYVAFSADGVDVGGGLHHPMPAQLAKQRASIADDAKGKPLAKAVAALERAGYEVGWDPLKTAPKGYSADHPRIDLLRHRNLIAMKHHPAAKAKDPVALVRQGWRDVRPVVEWLREHVGEA